MIVRYEFHPLTFQITEDFDVALMMNQLTLAGSDGWHIGGMFSVGAVIVVMLQKVLQQPTLRGKPFNG